MSFFLEPMASYQALYDNEIQYDLDISQPIMILNGTVNRLFPQFIDLTLSGLAFKESCAGFAEEFCSVVEKNPQKYASQMLPKYIYLLVIDVSNFF